MASRENSKANGKTTGELKLIDDESSHTTVLASLAWTQAPLCWLTPEQQNLLKQQSEIQRFSLGEKIWPKDGVGYQFLIVTGKVRLREEGVGKPLATLVAGDWFGILQKLPVECKAVAASKEVLVVRWNATVWTELSTPQIEEFWRGSGKDKEMGGWPDGEVERNSLPTTSPPRHPITETSTQLNYPFISSWNT
ncbi:MAG: type I secretion system permease/ATPase, partial [Fischerella sp.]|nr:type I secretion system permease/ATPase [Fischerella sp.]